jgi:hypothetical protein
MSSKIVRVTNQPVLKEPEAILPKDLPTEQPRPLAPLDQICVDNALENLFEFFQLRCFRMTSEEKHPLVISILSDDPNEYQCTETLAEIKTAGPEYVKEFYDFTTGYLASLL